jgi:hypothetical protein
MWNRRDWDDFFNIARKRWHNHRPPRPVDLSGRNRLVPAEGVPVDAGRVGSYGANVSVLRSFFRATRARL